MSDIVVSGKARKLIDEANTSYGRAKDLILAAYDVLTKEDKLAPEEAKEVLLNECTIFGKTTLYKFLPQESKDPVKAKVRQKSVPHVEHKSQENAPQPKIIHKTSDEINIPHTKPTITDAEIVDEEMTTEIEAVPPSRQRVTMPKKLLGKLYTIAGKYAKPFDFVLIIEDGEVIDVENQPVLELAK